MNYNWQSGHLSSIEIQILTQLQNMHRRNSANIQKFARNATSPSLHLQQNSPLSILNFLKPRPEKRQFHRFPSVLIMKLSQLEMITG